MIAFATLFLGLILGPQTVEMNVADDVALVELWLDGERIGRRSEAPWRFECDFGDLLEPHRLEAVAYDLYGKETGRVEQWVNLPRSHAEIELALDLDESGLESRVSIAWESVEGKAPETIIATLDGLPLDVADPRDVRLPPYDPQQLHFLRVEADWKDNLSALAEASFGGYYVDQVDTELTAIVVQTSDRGQLLTDGGQVQLRGPDGTSKLVAREKGPAEVVFVRDLRAEKALKKMVGRRAPNRSPNGYVPASLEKEHRARFLWTIPQARGSGERRYVLFPRSADFTATDGELPWMLGRMTWPKGAAEAQQLADAVAVSGLNAAQRGRRRAVVVVLGERASDISRLSPLGVRHYLGKLDVPLRVWTTDPDSWQDADHGWGEMTDVSDAFKLAKAVRRLVRDLERQQVLWFGGTHLPSEVEILGLPPGVKRAF